MCGNKTTMNNSSSLSFRLKMDNTSASQNASDVQIVDFPHFTSIEDCQERCGISNTDWCESIISFTRYETSFQKSHNFSYVFHYSSPNIAPYLQLICESAKNCEANLVETEGSKTAIRCRTFLQTNIQ